MGPEQELVSTPTPDPTRLTTEQLKREIGLLENELTRRLDSAHDYNEKAREVTRTKAEGDFRVLSQRIDGIDRATEVLNDIVTRVPTDVTSAVGHLRELMEEKFDSVGTQFKERDTRSERESRDNKLAVDAAFAAQEKQAAAQNKSNAEAIGKSETGTAETINKLEQLFQTTVKAASDKTDDLKERIGALENRKLGTDEARGISQWAVGFGLSVAVALLSILSFVFYVATHH